MLAHEMSGLWSEVFANRPLTVEMVLSAERGLGVVLPPAYVELMREQNGGYVDGRAIRLDLSALTLDEEQRYYVGDGNIEVSSILGIDPGRPEESIYCSAAMADEWGLPRGLILLDGDGHTWIALDYRAVKANPSVVYVITDPLTILPLAPSFAAFLERLLPIDDALLE